MTKDQIASLIVQTRQEHQHDKDGGYGLVFAILRLNEQMEDRDRKALQEHLLQSIAEQDPGLWGIALEVLVQVGSMEAAASLESMLREGSRDQEWVDQVVLDLLRIGYDGALDIYLSNIEANLSANRPVCAALAHLYKVAPDRSVRMSAQFFANSFFAGINAMGGSSCIAAFIYVYPKESENALLELVEETSLINPKAGEKLRVEIADYLSKPWLARDLGEERVARLNGMFNK